MPLSCFRYLLFFSSVLLRAEPYHYPYPSSRLSAYAPTFRVPPLLSGADFFHFFRNIFLRLVFTVPACSPAWSVDGAFLRFAWHSRRQPLCFNAFSKFPPINAFAAESTPYFCERLLGFLLTVWPPTVAPSSRVIYLFFVEGRAPIFC